MLHFRRRTTKWTDCKKKEKMSTGLLHSSLSASSSQQSAVIVITMIEMDVKLKENIQNKKSGNLPLSVQLN